MAFQYAAALMYKGVGVSCRIWSWVNPSEGQSGQGWWQRAKAQTTTHCVWLQVLLNDTHHQGAIHVDIHLTLVLKAREDMAGLVCIHQDLLLCLLQLRADQQVEWLGKPDMCAGRRCSVMHLTKQLAHLLADDIVTLSIQPIAVLNTQHLGRKINSVDSSKMLNSLPGCEAWWPLE